MGFLGKYRENIRYYFEKRRIRNNFKRKLKVHSRYAYRFAVNNRWAYGWYRQLIKTDIWKQAKDILRKYFIFEKGDLRCAYCYKKIELNSTPILHHRKYVWRKLFNPNYVCFVHDACHKRYHPKPYKRKRRRKSYLKYLKYLR